ncbi:MAG: hypothetical protein COB50_01030, partial [Thiotrichales bacterium]
MEQHFEKIIYIVLIAFLSSCISNNLRQVSIINKNEIIVVVSKFEDIFPIKTVGFMAFQNEKFELQVKDWNITKYIETSISKKLAHNY